MTTPRDDKRGGRLREVVAYRRWSLTGGQTAKYLKFNVEPHIVAVALSTLKSVDRCKVAFNVIFDSRMLCSSIFESLRSLAHSNCVNFNQAALRAVLKPENMSSAQTKQISVRFVCVHASSMLPFIAVSDRFNRCLILF